MAVELDFVHDASDAIVRVRGKLDYADSGAFGNAMEAAIAHDHAFRVVVDLQDCT